MGSLGVEAGGGELGGADLGDQAAVGVTAAVVVRAHAVDDLHAGLGRGRDDVSSRTHAKRKDADVACPLDQAVGGGAEGGVTGERAVLHGVDLRLRVLDAHAHGEGLERELDAVRGEPAEDVAGGVSGGEHDGLGVDHRAVGEADADRAAAAEEEAIDAGGEAQLGAGRPEVLAHAGDHAREAVGADVRASVDEDLRRGAVAGERAQDGVDRAALAGAGVELAVREGAGAAFAVAIVALRVELAALAEAGEVVAAGSDGFASLEHERADPRLREAPGAEEAGRAGADDDDARRAAHGR
jgi:hypothetical protein